jgi:hypothetical protein
MRKLAIGIVAAALGACSFTTIADRYGNEYGDWYNPGSHFTWQLDLCEHQMESGNVPPMQRKAAMRCCMRDHGVPVDDMQGCAA